MTVFFINMLHTYQVHYGFLTCFIDFVVSSTNHDPPTPSAVYRGPKTPAVLWATPRAVPCAPNGRHSGSPESGQPETGDDKREPGWHWKHPERRKNRFVINLNRFCVVFALTPTRSNTFPWWTRPHRGTVWFPATERPESGRAVVRANANWATSQIWGGRERETIHYVQSRSSLLF